MTNHATRRARGFVAVAGSVFLMLVAPVRGATTVWTNLTLVDQVICSTDTTHMLTEYPGGNSVVSNIFGSSCRALRNTSSEMQYFAYRLGQGKGLQAGKGYVLHVEYPEDQPRSTFVLNHGCETARGFHTGSTLGDHLHNIVFNNCESLELPLSGGYEIWEQLFFLHDRFPDIKKPRDDEYPRSFTPADGFWVIILQLSRTNEPTSAGSAVRRIALYEAPAFGTYALTQPSLPAGLPGRHLFWREEMSDSVIDSSDPQQRGVTNELTWYESKIKLSRFLGMNTFSKDLLEFGSNQGWDSSKYGGNNWVFMPAYSQRWHNIVVKCGEYGLNVMPYYEYYGGLGYNSLGSERRARPLGDVNGVYTPTAWTETYNADLTDPDTLTDLQKLLDVTVLEEQSYANFVGAWFRHRPSSMPIGFADPTLERFRVEANGGTAVARWQLSSDSNLLQRYYTWWNGRRKDLLVDVRDFLWQNVNSNQVVLYTPDATEPGVPYPSFSRPSVVAESTSQWITAGETCQPYSNWVAENRHWIALTSPPIPWPPWEWEHSIPPPDPQALTNEDGVMFTYTFNRAYTVANATNMDAFTSAGGLALVRHYALNEFAADIPDVNRGVGYFVSDVELTGPFCMMAEAMAMANGDPRYLGYLSSSSFNRGFPYYVRRFNQNFLALPALRGRRDASYSGHSNLAVRVFETASNGIYLAAVHLGRAANSNLTLLLPGVERLTDAVTGQTLAEGTNRYTLSMYPFELRALLYMAPPTIPSVVTNEVRIASSAGDAEENLTNGAVSVTSGDLELTVDTGNGGYTQMVGLCFQNVQVPAGAPISNAWIQFNVDETLNQSGTLTIQAQDHDSAPGFSTAVYDISARTRTAPSVTWSPDPWTIANSWPSEARTPNIAGLVQAVVNRAGWSNGNSLAIIISGTGQRIAESWDGASAHSNLSFAPLLHIEYGTGGSSTSHGVPYSWLAAFGITNNQNQAENNDPDNDGAPTWKEYYAGTSPTNRDSVFKILNIDSNGGIKWYGTTNSGVYSPFRTYRSTNLPSGVWTLADSNVVRSGTGTNVWTDPSPPQSPAVFYKVAM